MLNYFDAARIKSFTIMKFRKYAGAQLDTCADNISNNIIIIQLNEYIRIPKRERIGSVVECLTRDQRAAGSSLTSVTALWSLSKTHLS